MSLIFTTSAQVSQSNLCESSKIGRCYGNLSVKAKAALSKIVNSSGKIIGAQQSSLTDLYNRFVCQTVDTLSTLRSSCYLQGYASNSLL